MGSSGAGKTTLMDVIAARKNSGRIEGRIGVNGFPMQKASWSRTLAYVEQADVHSPQLTVYESLVVSASLRLPRSTSKAARMNQVSTTLATVRPPHAWDPWNSHWCYKCSSRWSSLHLCAYREAHRRLRA